MNAHLPPWRIEVWAKTIKVGDTEIPQHQIGEECLKNALKAMVLAQLGTSVDFVARNYVNARKGKAVREGRYNPKWFGDPENRRQGWWCGDWEHCGLAWLPLSPEDAVALKCVIDDSQKHSTRNARLNKLIATMSDEEYRALFARAGAVEALLQGES